MEEKLNENEKSGITPEQKPVTVQTERVVIQQPSSKKRIGKNRSVFAPLLLPIITLGIYTFVWIYKVFTEADHYCEGKVNITSGGAAVVFLFIPIFNIVWAIMLWFKTPGLLTKMQMADGVPENKLKHYGHYGWLNFIPILGGILWIILTQSAFNQYWDNVRQRN